MPAPTITELPPPPLRSESPTTFSGTAETFVEALPEMVDEINAFINYLNGLALSGVTGPITGTALTMATNRLLGRVSASTGTVEELTLSHVLDMIGSAAHGDILYRGASGWARLAAGTSGYVLQTQGAGANPQWAATPVAAVSSQSGTSYTAVLGDANSYVRFTNGSAVSFTIPSNSSVAFPVGTVIEMEQAGAGALSVVAGSGVTINSRSADLTLAGQYSVAFVKKVATDTWTMNGDL